MIKRVADDRSPPTHPDTTGKGMNRIGCHFRLAQQESKNSRWLDFVADHLSISWTKFDQDSDSGISDTSYTEFKILF